MKNLYWYIHSLMFNLLVSKLHCAKSLSKLTTQLVATVGSKEIKI